MNHSPPKAEENVHSAREKPLEGVEQSETVATPEKEEPPRGADYLEQLKRTQADFENYRRRTEKQTQEIVEFSCSALVGKLLPVLDSFDRGLASARASQDFQGMLEGFELIRKQIWEVLQQEGLQALETKGRAFDPSEHEAVMQQETAEYPDDTVMEELQKGYKFKSRVIRPALVKVAGGWKKKEEMKQSMRDKEDKSDG